MATGTRPRAPNIQIYRPQLTSVLSFGHRLTGLWLSLGAVLLVAWLLAAAAGAGPYGKLQSLLGSWPGLALLLGWTYALFYHLCNGIRHLLWDTGYGFALSAIYLSGWIVVIASIALTLIAWVAGALVAG